MLEWSVCEIFTERSSPLKCGETEQKGVAGVRRKRRGQGSSIKFTMLGPFRMHSG